jgi:translocation and assembly module TamB
LLGLVGSIGLALLIMLGAVLGTQTGLRFAIGLAEDLAPGVLRVERAEGRVLGRLDLRGVELRLSEGFATTVGSMSLDWSPFAALAGTLPITKLLVSDLDITLPPSSDEPTEPFVLPDLVLPLGIELGQARVERLRLFTLGETSPFLTLDHADLSATVKRSELHIGHLDVALSEPRVQARAKGQAILLGQYPLSLDLDWSLEQSPSLALAGEARVRGDLSLLEIHHRLTGSARGELDVQVKDALGHRLAWDGRLEILGVDLPDLDPEWPEVAIAGRLETRGNLERATVTGGLDAKAPQLPDFGHLAVVLDLAWAEQILEIRAIEMTEQVSEARLSATGQLDLGSDSGLVELSGNWERLRWPLTGDLVAEAPEGKIEVSGTLDAFEYLASLSVLGPDLPATRLSLNGLGTQRDTRIVELRLEMLGGEVTGEGEVTWAPELRWALSLKAKDLDPGSLVEGLDDRLALQLTTSGGLAGFEYDLDAQSVGPGLPPSQLRLEGQGDVRETRIESIVLETLGGLIEGQVEVGWDPQVIWSATLDASGLNPGVYAADWPGSIDARLTSRGTLEPSGPDLTATIEQLEGDLRGYLIEASGKVTMIGESIRIEDLSAASGPSALRLQGRIEETLDLSFDLESSDLASLLPEARGSLTARGKVSGPRDAPRVSLDLSARDAEWAGQGIAGLTGTLDLGISPEDPFDVRLDGQGLVTGDMRWSSLSVRGSGRLPDHRIELALKGDPLALTVETSGGLDGEGAYLGQIARLDLASPTFGDWGLRSPAPISIAGPRVGLGPLCIRGPKGNGGCFDLNQEAADRWVASLDLALGDLTVVQPLLPENLAISGKGQVKGRFEAEGPVLSGSATAELPQGALRVSMGGGRDEVIDFSGTRLGLDASARALAARLAVPLGGLGRIDGTLDLAGWRLDDPARPGQPLGGTLGANIEGLDRVSNLVPDLTGMTGGIDMDFRLGGTIAAPGVSGEARVTNVGFEVPLVGLRVSDLNLKANAPAMHRMDLQGHANVGGGRLELNGDARFDGGAFASQIRVSGERLKVADTREYFALVSPDIQFEAKADGARLSGEIKIPEARIRPRSVPAGTRTPSSDVVLEDGAGTVPYPLDIDLRLRLGDDVTIDAFGVRGRLAGDLSLLQPPGREMLGNGQLQIIDGQYRLAGGLGLAAEFGAPLTIVQGRMIFARSPIGNPGLLLQAEREGGSTVAGVRVLGTLRDPKLAFFSETDPGMTQAEITKFLLTGIAPSSNEDAAAPGLAVGTYIAPKIFLEYESGLGDDPNSVRLRYDLTNRIEIQTETGARQGADIFFTFER